MGFFNFLKKKDTFNTEIDFSSIGVDFHSHLIPMVDDGVRTVEETAEILDNFITLGYKKIYTSPHIMGEGYTNTKNDLIHRFNSLKADPLIVSKNIEFELIAEYYMDENFEKLVESEDLLTFGQKNILIETSMNYEFPNFKELIFKLNNLNYKPILAHPERYNFIHNESNYINTYEELKDKGVLLQLNLFSLIGLYGQKTKKVAEELIDQDLIDFVSSDIHNVKQLEFFKKLSESAHFRKLLDSNQLKNHTL